MTTPTPPLDPNARSAAASLAHEHLDAAPPAAMTVEDYEWQMRLLGFAEMQATDIGPEGDVDPDLSGDHPIVVSYGDGERTPIQVWDGVHRIVSTMNRGHGDRMAAVGVKKEGVMFLEDLPDDMNALLHDICEDAAVHTPTFLPTRAVRVDRFPVVPLADGKNDERGPAHVARMAGQCLPPVLVNGDAWMDGRHRIQALREAGIEWVSAIDLQGKVPILASGPLHLGFLAAEKKNTEEPMPPKTATGAHTPEEIAMVLASLGEPTLISHLQIRSQVQDPRTVQAAFEAGFFDIRSDIDALPDVAHKKNATAADNVVQDEITDDWANRFQSITGFLRNGTQEGFHVDPIMGATKGEMTQMVFGASTEFRSVYEKVAEDLVDQMHWVLGKNKRGMQARGDDPMDTAFTLLAAGAVLLDLPKTVEKIISMVPESSVTCIDASLLGPVFQKNLLDDSLQYRVSLAGVALQFSRMQCLESIKSADPTAMGPDFLLGQFKPISDKGASYQPLTFLQNLEKPILQMDCDLSSFRWAVAHQMASSTPQNQRKTIEVALNTLDNESNWHPYVQCFLAAGCYDKDPSEAVRYAAIYGEGEVVRGAGNPPMKGNGRPESGRQVGKVDWETMAKSYPGQESTLYKTLESVGRNVEGAKDSALAWVQRAKSEGHFAEAVGMFRHSPFDSNELPVRAEPLHLVVLHDVPKVLVAMLNEGIPGTEPVFENTPSALSMSETLDKPTVAHAIRAWGLRESAMGIMEKMDQENKTKTGPSLR